NGTGGLAGADNGGLFPSSAFGRVTSTSRTLLSSTVNIAALGQSPQDGFTQYLNYPSATFAFRPRWGDYGGAIVAGGKAYFASEYIQSPNCAPPAFQPNAFGICGGARNRLADWGASGNHLPPSPKYTPNRWDAAPRNATARCGILRLNPFGLVWLFRP